MSNSKACCKTEIPSASNKGGFKETKTVTGSVGLKSQKAKAKEGKKCQTRGKSIKTLGSTWRTPNQWWVCSKL